MDLSAMLLLICILRPLLGRCLFTNEVRDVPVADM
jgi:hypothetical protein